MDERMRDVTKHYQKLIKNNKSLDQRILCVIIYLISILGDKFMKVIDYLKKLINKRKEKKSIIIGST